MRASLEHRRQQRRYSNRQASMLPGEDVRVIGDTDRIIHEQRFKRVDEYLDGRDYIMRYTYEREMTNIESNLLERGRLWLESYYNDLGISNVPLHFTARVTNFELIPTQYYEASAKEVQKDKVENIIRDSPSALEEGMTTIIQHRFMRDEIFKKSDSEILNQLAAALTRMSTMPNPSTVVESLIFANDISNGMFSASNEQYTDSVRLVKFLCMHITGFELLFQRSRILGEHKLLWRSINSIFGLGSAELVAEATISNALDIMRVLSTRLSPPLPELAQAISEELRSRSERSQVKVHPQSIVGEQTNRLQMMGAVIRDPAVGENVLYVNELVDLDAKSNDNEDVINWMTLLLHELHHATRRLDYRIQEKPSGDTVVTSLSIGGKNNEIEKSARKKRVTDAINST